MLPVTLPTFVAPLRVNTSPTKAIFPPFALMELELPSTTPLLVPVPHVEKFRLNKPTGELITVPLPVEIRPPDRVRVALLPVALVIALPR